MWIGTRSTLAGISPPPPPRPIVIIPGMEAPPAGMGLIKDGGEGVEIIVPDHDVEVKAKDSQILLLKEGTRSTMAGILPPPPPPPIVIVPDMEAPPAGMGLIMDGGEGVEIIVQDHNLEVKAKDSQIFLLKEIRDEYRRPQCLAFYLAQKRCIIQIKNKDCLGCARAIVTARARLDRHPKWNSIRLGRGEQLHLVRQLHIDAGNDAL